ncbi:uncharacterized protein LOC126095606 [Schistocerca cancellata]|uniref:uncharacterized protein LOC126095606 n=1 Tax=Schistocerca cancellata TaxID=274614 RepID=UPI0021191115|nr:uncharacterized protein LOC126095606 [Schistocerca cancellata]
MNPREVARAEFYGTYDPMTGIRIAGTLGGFFSLMVLLVVYKSRCKGGSSRCSLAGDPAVQRAWAERLQREADAAEEAEDRSRREQLAKLYAAAAAERLSHRSSGSTRRSSRGTGTPRHLSSAASSRLGLGLNPGEASGGSRHCGLQMAAAPMGAAGADADADAEGAPAAAGLQLLSVPGWSRRLSSVTCSSSDTSYLERRGSAVECGLPAPPPGAFRRLRPPLLPRCDDVRDWDFYYPIDIQVIQPTPDASPCGSERTLYAAVLPQAQLLPGAASARPSLSRPASPAASASLSPPAPPPRLAPLASISSCAASLRTDDCASVGSDSVFLDDDDVLDTEDEVEGFSTDSDEGDGSNRVRHFLQVPPTVRTFTPTKRWSDGAASYYRPRRLLPRQAAITSQLSVSTEDTAAAAEVERVARRPPCPLPPDARHSSSSSSGSPTLKETRF